MVSVATQQAKNPIHLVAKTLNLPVSQTITKKLDLPVKLLFPRNLFLNKSFMAGGDNDFIMLGLGDMAIPGMLLALIICFDHRKKRDYNDSDFLLRGRGCGSDNNKYIWHGIGGYAVGLIIALSMGVLTKSPQPALLYLVPSTLGPVSLIAWIRNDFGELWYGKRFSGKWPLEV